MQQSHVIPPSTAALLAPQIDSDLLSLPWLSVLNDGSNHALSSLDTPTTTTTSDQTYQRLCSMSSAQDKTSIESGNVDAGAGDLGHMVLSSSHIPSSQAVGYTPSHMVHTGVATDQNSTSVTYVPVTSQSNDEPQSSQNSQMNDQEQSYTFNVADYASFRYQLSQIQQAESVVTQQPQSSANQTHLITQPQILSQSQSHAQVVTQPQSHLQVVTKPQCHTQVVTHTQPHTQVVTQPQPVRVPQPSHLISPLLAQPCPQLPSGLRNSNYLVRPIIARPSTMPRSDKQEIDGEEKTKAQETPIPQSTPNTSVRDDDSSSDQIDSSVQVQFNQFAHISIPVNYQHQLQGQHVHYDGVIPSDNQTASKSPQSLAPTSITPTVHSTEFLLSGVHPAPSQSESIVSQPVCSQTSQSASTESSDDDSDKLAIADVTSSEPSSDDSGTHIPETPSGFSQHHPVNIWEQHVASARVAASGVAHPKPVRLSSGFSSVFPSATFPWASTSSYHQPLHPAYPAGLPTLRPESRPQDTTTPAHSAPEQCDSVAEHVTSEHNLKLESQQTLCPQADSLSYFLSEFPKSLDSLTTVQSQSHVQKPAIQQTAPDTHPHSQYSDVPDCNTPENKQPANQGVSIFSHNTFMSPSFFTRHAHSRPDMHTELPPVSSTPEANPSPMSNGKISDDDSAIDVNSGSSTTSPTSSIDSRGSPELITLHLQNEDSNSSVGDNSLLRSRSSSVSSICDSSISSTASSNNSFSVPKGNKRSNPDPDLGTYKKKSRTSYTPGQLRALERVYMENPYPECDTIDRLARDIDIPEQRLRVWFQNKRARMRRQAKQNKQIAPHPPVNPYNAQPMSAIMSSASPYSFLPPNSMMNPGQPAQLMQRPFFPYPQGASGPMMQHPMNVSSAPGISQHPPSLVSQQPPALTPQQSQIQRLYSFIAHKQPN